MEMISSKPDKPLLTEEQKKELKNYGAGLFGLGMVHLVAAAIWEGGARAADFSEEYVLLGMMGIALMGALGMALAVRILIYLNRNKALLNIMGGLCIVACLALIGLVFLGLNSRHDGSLFNLIVSTVLSLGLLGTFAFVCFKAAKV